MNKKDEEAVAESVEEIFLIMCSLPRGIPNRPVAAMEAFNRLRDYRATEHFLSTIIGAELVGLSERVTDRRMLGVLFGHNQDKALLYLRDNLLSLYTQVDKAYKRMIDTEKELHDG